MKITTLLTLALALASAAQAHFSFVTPLAGGNSAELFISETLEPDIAVDVTLLKGTRLMLRDNAGNDRALTLEPGKNVYAMKLPGSGIRTIHGLADLGLSAAGPAKKPYLLLYYPKAILGAAFEAKPIAGAAVVELIPQGSMGKTALLFVAKGQPQPNTEITVILPDGTQKQVKTDTRGLTPFFDQTGRYGAWARFWEPATGLHDGKPYEELRHYATLVFDVLPKADPAGTLPEASASLGAVADNGFLYVYGGHIAKTHNYSTTAVSGKFHRMNLATKQWEELPGGPALQGMNLAAHNGKIYRIGGMEPRNKAGEKQLNFSIPDVARYDPVTRTWENLPPLPEPRSSHDVVVIGDQLIVTSGWEMKGESDSAWSNKMFLMDLAAPRLSWHATAQPFQRRALITAVHQERMYVIGGIQPNDQVSLEVDIFNPRTGGWSQGPALPGPAINGFAPAAVDHQGTLFASIGNGKLLRLNHRANRWVDAGESTPRLAHRMVSSAQGILIAGGADNGDNSNLVESIPIAAPPAAIAK